MAKQFRTSIDLAKNELQNARVQNLGSAPGSPATGQIWFNTATGKIEYRGTSATVDPTDRAQHTGSQPSSTISDLATVVKAYRLDEFAEPTADVSFGTKKATNLALATLSTDSANLQNITNAVAALRLNTIAASADVPLGGYKITGLANGTSAQDAVTLAQLQQVQNGTDWKESARVATTANLAALSGLLTVDGVTLVAGDRVLVKDQTTTNQNGIYVAASGAWTRAADAVQGTLTPDAALFVEEGTQADTQWRLTTNGPLTIGTTALSFAQIGASTTYTPGTGVSIAGSVISVDSAVVVRKYATDIGGATSMPVTHGLNTRDVVVRVFDNATFEEIEVDILRTSVNVVTIGSNTAPAAAAWRCVVQG